MNFTFNKKNYTFKPKFVPLVSFVIALLILLSLSLWQVKRLVWKTNLIEQRVSNFEGEPKGLDNPELLTMKWHHGQNSRIVNGITIPNGPFPIIENANAVSYTHLTLPTKRKV